MEDSWTGVIENTLGIFDNYDNLSGEFDLYISGREYEYEKFACVLHIQIFAESGV